MSAPNFRNRLLLAGGMIVAVGAAVVAWRARQASGDLDDAIAAVQRQRVIEDGRAQELQQKIAATTTRRTELEAELKRLRAAPAATRSKSDPPPRPSARARNSPEQQALAQKRFRAGLIFENLAFYRTAGLDEKQIARFEDILTEHQGRERDVQATQNERRLSPKDPALVALRAEETARFEGELKDLLGEDGRKRFDEYQRNAVERRAVSELVSNLALTPTPLSPEQGRQFAATLKEVGFRERKGDLTMWNDLAARSQAFLSPPQLAELQAMTFANGEVAFNALDKLAAKKK